MEIIRKRINLNDYVSRTPALVPYIKTEKQGDGDITEATNRNGSWGSIMCDYTGNNESTVSMFNKYYRIKEICRNGLKLKKIERRDGVFYIENFSDYVDGDDFTPTSSSLMERVGKGLYKEKEETGGIVTSAYIRLISPEDYETYQILGGSQLIVDVEDMIGIISIPATFTGSKVPRKMYLSGLEAYVDWFEINHGYKYMPTTQAAYDSAEADDKAEFFGSLPTNIGSTSPTFAKLTRSLELPTGLAMKVNYYKKVDAEPNDCCLREEWDARGGAALWKYLISKRGQYSGEIEKWRKRIEEGSITIPSIDFQVLLTQVYDDNGVMTPVGEDWYVGNESKTVYRYQEIPSSGIPAYIISTVPTMDSVPSNPKTTSETYIKVGSKYYFLFPELYVDEGPFETVSKLDTLRTRERVYDDDGTVLPFVNLRQSGGDWVADIPYRVNEVKNLGIDVNGKRSYGDYIDSIDVNDTAITFTYYIGGEYDASKGANIKLSKAIGECNSGGKAFSLTVTAQKSWTLLSVSGDWLIVSGVEQNRVQSPGTKSVTVNARANTTLDVRTGSVTFGVVERGYYEEVTFSIVQQPNVNSNVINFDGTSNYTMYFGGLAGSTGGTYQSTTGLTNFFSIVCVNSAWYVKSKTSWLTVDPVRGEENISTKMTVTARPTDGPIRFGEILLVAVGNPNITKTLKVIQAADSVMRYVAESTPSACTIEYNETTRINMCMEVREGSAVTVLGSDRWTYDIIGGNPSLFRVSRGQNYFSITNCNTSNTENTLAIKSYVKNEPTVCVTTSVTAKPKSASKKADVYIHTPTNIVEYGKSVTMGTVLVPKYGNTVNSADWDYVCEPEYSTMKDYVGIYTDKTAGTITIKNANKTGSDKKFSIYTYYTQDNTCKSSAVTMTLRAPEAYTSLGGKLTLDPNYKAFACVQIWPSCSNSDTGSVYATGSNWPGTSFAGSGWSGPTLIKDPNNRYKIKVFNGMYGNVSQFKVTLKKRDGTVGWYAYMRYDVEEWFTITPFEDGNGLYIDAIIETA